jgi:endonuclease/exonuclease/phosphatase family metal-dependent hydrolase
MIAAMMMSALLCASCAALDRIDPCDPSIQLAGEPAQPGSIEATTRIVTYNVHGESARSIGRALIEVAALRRADIILLQEIEDHTAEGRSRAAQIASRLEMAHAYAPGYGLPRGGSHGVAILSRFPISDVELIELPRYSVRFNSARRVALAATVTIGDKPIRVYSVHLDNRVSPSRRVAQMAPVIEDARVESIERVVIAGDLNTSPFCWVGHVLPIPCGKQTRRLEKYVRGHGFATPVVGSGATSKWLSMRLDGIYTRGLDRVDSGVASAARVSDHLPLWMDIEL